MSTPNEREAATRQAWSEHQEHLRGLRNTSYRLEIPADDLDNAQDSGAFARINRYGKRWDQLVLSAAILLLIALAGVVAGIWLAIAEFTHGL